jgi:hypothetical protein
LDGNIRKLRGSERFRYSIYYHCATQFGWDKETVDKQELNYLKKLFATHVEAMDDAKNNRTMPPISKNMSKNFK